MIGSSSAINTRSLDMVLRIKDTAQVRAVGPVRRVPNRIHSNMRASLERMLEGAIDFAGLYPPAKLDMVVAVKEYIRCMEGAPRWIVDRFVCPVARLREFEVVVARMRPASPVPISVVLTGGADIEAFEAALELDAQELIRFHESVGEAFPIEAFELKTPSLDVVETVVDDLAGFDEVEGYLELPLGDDLVDALAKIAETEWLGAKVRTGGVEAAAFPAADHLAEFLQGCVHVNVPFKLTAGLHHPLRHMNKALGVPMHGFVNVFTAVVLAAVHDLSRADIEEVLLCETPKSFAFDDARMEWNGLCASLEDIDDARTLLVGFGSCSVKEPLDGLAALGWSGEKVR